MLPPALAFAGDLDAWRKFRARWNAASTWSAEFSQTMDLGDGAAPLVSAGRVLLSRPGLVRWEYAGGPARLVVGDGRWLWVYQAELEQAYKVSYSQSLVHSLVVALLGAPGAVEAGYEVVRSGIDQGGQDVFRLTPRDRTGLVLELTVSGGSELAALAVVEAAGTRNEVIFTQAARDLVLASSLFSFTPPAGTDVIVRQ